MAGVNDPLAKKEWFPQYTGYQAQASTIEMYDNLTAQQFQISGIPIDFIPCIVDVDKDRIFGEDTTKQYLQKYSLTGILKDGQVEETLFFNSYGSLNTSEFSLYLNIGTFRRILGKDRSPKPGDNLFFSNGNSNLGFEVMNCVFSTLGTQGNILGFKSCFEIVCREREISEADLGIGEMFGSTYRIQISSDLVGMTLQIVNKNVVQIFSPTTADVGKIVSVLSATAPVDILVNDGSGRIKEKYIVKGKDVNAQKGDNVAISKITDHNSALPPSSTLIDVRPEGNTVPFDKTRWGDW